MADQLARDEEFERKSEKELTGRGFLGNNHDSKMPAAELYTVLLIAINSPKHEVAEIYESDENLANAVIYHEKSAHLYQSEVVTTFANECSFTVAQFAAQVEHECKQGVRRDDRVRTPSAGYNELPVSCIQRGIVMAAKLERLVQQRKKNGSIATDCQDHLSGVCSVLRFLNSALGIDVVETAFGYLKDAQNSAAKLASRHTERSF